MLRLLLPALLGLTLLLAAPSARAQDTAAAEAEAVQAALAWLALVDAGDYAASWDQAALFFRSVVAQTDWPGMIAAAREPFGEVLSRQPASTRFAASLPGAPDGEYVVIEFATSFARKAQAVETVTPMRDPDGVWRVSGYYIR